MSIFRTLAFYLPRLSFRRAAMRGLSERFGSVEASMIWRETQLQQRKLQPLRPRHSPGVNLVLRYLEWDCALYTVLRSRALSEQKAGTLIEAINWDIFRAPVATGFAVSGLRSSGRQARIQWLLDCMFLLVFSAPFKRRVLPAEEGVIAFDVLGCPLAAYCRDRGVPELTRFAACSLDYHMAADWGIALDRTQTIAEGSPFCDFRFKVEPLTKKDG